MKVHLIKKKTIMEFVENHGNSSNDFDKWLSLISAANWQTTEDVSKTFTSVDFLGNGNNRMIFNVGGNKFRIICSYYFGQNFVRLYVKWIGTHAEYNQLCKTGKQYII